MLGLSILHLLENRHEVIRKVYVLLKPGGVFVSSTACLGGTVMRFTKNVAPLGSFLGVLPLVKVFTPEELEGAMVRAGLSIAHRWQPAKAKALFIVAKKAE